MSEEDRPAPAGPQQGASPQFVALGWVEAVMDRADLAAAWPVTDAALRLVLVQDWLWAHRSDPVLGGEDLDGLASLLSRQPPEHFLWDRFAEDRLTEWQAVWRGFSARTWRALEDPEIVDLDLEIVTLVEGAEASEGTRAGLRRRFLLHHTEAGWRVAGLNGQRRFLPGWPPTPD